MPWLTFGNQPNDPVPSPLLGWMVGALVCAAGDVASGIERMMPHPDRALDSLGEVEPLAGLRGRQTAIPDAPNGLETIQLTRTLRNRMASRCQSPAGGRHLYVGQSRHF